MLRTSTFLLPESLAKLVHPSPAALLVYDLQVGIVKQLPDGVRIMAAIRQLITLAQAHGLRIAYTRHLSPPRPWRATATRTAMRWQRQSDPERLAPPFGRMAPASQIVEDLAPTPTTWSWKKPRCRHSWDMAALASTLDDGRTA